MSMNIDKAVLGTVVTITEETKKNGSDFDRALIDTYIGDDYNPKLFLVQEVRKDDWITRVKFIGFPKVWFNSVNFDDIEGSNTTND